MTETLHQAKGLNPAGRANPEARHTSTIGGRQIHDYI